MPENITINVTPQPTASVDVRADNVASYYYELAKQWAISDSLVEQLDYSSKYYANVSKGYKEDVDELLSDSGFIAVSESLTNINAVADDLTNIDTVANNTTDINYVADIGTDISTLADISLDITAVNNNATNINACATNASNINTVAGDIANVNTVAGDKTNIDTVAGISGNVTTVAGISTDVTSVAGISSAVSAVNTNASNINAVSSDLTNINSVASDLTNIDSVVSMNSAITTVNSNSTKINTCATNISNINTCAANISTIADKVSKSGDTMTGDLTILGNSTKLCFNNSGSITEMFSSWSSATKKSFSIKIDTSVFGLSHNTTDAIGYIFASNDVKQSITNWSFPSTTYTDLSSHWTVSGFTVTAPANGWLQISIENAGDGLILLSNLTSGLTNIVNNMGTVGLFGYLPAAKNDILQVDYLGTSTLNLFGFRHAIGG